ncbi:methyltransferase [Acinetobacter sp. NCu2D-2]|uniref:SAM-dependent methyltransferase n=1 Tax=Acinetobacter sp. NCu2D-2 TaxID=1608473 RepID=UPI0007CDD0EE|nr:SAM-dependent methyltransferase [Acinetobacter sp. NCu2D-2]ANF81769.1 methyltransferase [Acinetobacter sp. NCu2D-2]
MNTAYDAEYFDELYQENDGDPWQYEHRWYEARKRAMALALLPQQYYRYALEIGCSTGVFSEQLAHRCEKLDVLDAHPKAIEHARHRLKSLNHVQILQAEIPQELPAQKYDLIVLSEVLYYLNSKSVAQVIDWLKVSLQPNGCIVACHWIHPIGHFEFTGVDVHEHLINALPYRHYAHVEDMDFKMDLWTFSNKSVAEQEGLL